MTNVHAEQTLVTIPMGGLSGVAADEVLKSRLSVHFPKECAWCGSKDTVAERPIQFYVDNPRYVSSGSRTARKVAGVVAGTILGGVTGNILAYSALAPDDLAKISGFAFEFNVPHCVEHVSAPPGDAFQLVEVRGDLSALTIRVRTEQYAGLIVDYSDLYTYKHLYYLSLEDLNWPDICFVCGQPHAGDVSRQ